MIFWAKPLSVPTGPPLRGSHRCHERVRAQPRSSGASPCPAQPLTMSGDTRCPLLVPRGRTALGTSHNSGGSHCPHPRQHSLVPPPRGDPPASPPLPEGMRHGEAPLQADALVHQELPEENRGIAGGTARGRGRRSPRRAVRGGQHGPVQGPPGRRRGPAGPGAEQEACGRPGPGSPAGKLSIPLPPCAWEIKQLSGSGSRRRERVPPRCAWRPGHVAPRWPGATGHPAVPEAAAAPQRAGVLCLDTRKNAPPSP